MDEDSHEREAEHPRRCILTSHSRQHLEAKVLELMLEGWERVGDIGMAKSVVTSESSYLTQAMVLVRSRTRSEQGDLGASRGTKAAARRKD